MTEMHLFHTFYGHDRSGASNAFVIDLGRHLNILWTIPLNGDADMGRVLIAMQ
jgi:hypothetical protein